MDMPALGKGMEDGDFVYKPHQFDHIHNIYIYIYI